LIGEVVKFITTYLTLLCVSTGCIALGTKADICVAFATAAVSCLFKTVAVKIHDKFWENKTPA
jgi:uncharacterized membrane protein